MDDLSDWLPLLWTVQPQMCPQQRLLQLFKLGLCFFQNRNVRVGVLPQRKEIMVSRLRLH